MPEQRKVTESAQELYDYLHAPFAAIHVSSYEQERVTDDIIEFSKSRDVPRELYFWNFTDGLSLLSGGFIEPVQENGRVVGVKNPIAALAYVRTLAKQKKDQAVDKPVPQAFFLMYDLMPFVVSSVEVRDALKRMVKTCYDTTVPCRVISISHHPSVPEDLEQTITVIDYALPTREELVGIIERTRKGVPVHPKPSTPSEDVARAAAGLTLEGCENALAISMAVTERLTGMREFDPALIMREKKNIVRKSGILDFYETDLSFQDVGGLDCIKEWALKRRNVMSDEARAFGIPALKGVLLTGISGCGKSLMAKVIASYFGWPLLRFDVGRAMGRYVGSSEENVRRAIKVAESVAPCVLWIDEMEKALAGSQSSGASDAGTTSRVISTLLTWMEEKTVNVFVAATTNNISQLPAEMVRRGRFDEIFFTDLPNRREREEIARIHIAKRGWDPDEIDLDRVVAATAEYTGAEIEQAVIDALFLAFDSQERRLTADHLIEAAQSIIPLSRSMSEQIREIKDWAKVRARPASPLDERRPSPKRKRKVLPPGGGRFSSVLDD